MRPIVLDASVFVKTLRMEPGTQEAEALINWALSHQPVLHAPEVFRWEVLGAAHRMRLSVPDAARGLDALCASLLELSPAETSLFLEADAISTRAAADGRSQLVDCAYHALALRLGGVFLTADDKHHRKTSRLIGDVLLLDDWQQLQRA